MSLEAKRIFELLDEIGISEYELSQRSGMSHGAFCAWKKYHRVPRVSSINKICKILDISRAEIYTKGVFAKKPDDPKDDVRFEMKQYCNRIIENGDAGIVLPILQKLSKKP